MVKILFCEDEEPLRELFCMEMESLDYEIYVAADGLEGFKIVDRERPDLILTDIAMPNCDGFQLAKAVRERPYLSTTPIIFVTAYGDKYDKKEAEKYKPVEYLIKPFDAADLRDIIHAALLKHARQDRR
jgi:two-component system alkaline phosphatase synthesis response regulator PhoP